MTSRLVAFAEAERAMKVQEVILRAASGQIKWYQAAEILGISDRQIRRVKCDYEKYGVKGLFDGRRKQPSLHRISAETVNEVIRLYRDEFNGFNVQHFYQEMKREHPIDVSYTWVKYVLQNAGLIAKEKKRGKYRRRRERKPLTGMLLHIDGSPHRWFEHSDDERQTLIAIIDDATGECLAAKFFKEEGTKEVMELIKSVVIEHGTFIALYTDRASHFAYTPTAGGPIDHNVKTQLELALDELGIELIRAYSPQARGRSERAWRTMQGRLPLELKRLGIVSYDAANRYLSEVYLSKHNQLFTVKPEESGTAFMPIIGVDLERVFSLRENRVVNSDNTISFNNRILQLPKVANTSTLAKKKVEVREHLDGTLEVLRGKQLLARFPSTGTDNKTTPQVAPRVILNRA